MSSNNDKRLCSSCSKVNLHSLIEGRTKYITAPNEFDEFWDLSEVLNQPNCPLCRLLSSCFRTADDFDFVKVGRFDRICGVYVGSELQVSISRQGSITRSSYSIQNCATNNQTEEEPEVIKPAYFAIEELRSWLFRCDEGHRECQPSIGPSEPPIPKGFRVIDVERGCVVRVKSDITYCALSYVWGMVDQVVLTRLNLMDLEKEHALFGGKFALSKTIMDAIKLCQNIGQKYLWIDCLCIIQDEEEEKHIQLTSMDAIYHLACLTIIAAAGDDANAGLSPFNSPRLNSDFSISIETISGNTFISSLSPSITAQTIAESTWATRGWTLQEYALSKRAVIFTGQYAFFRCEKALWGEDFRLKLSSFYGNGPHWNLPLYRLSSPQDATRHYSEVYPQLVTEYVSRALTDEEDILNAFLGILRRLRANIGHHFWGLPSKEFGSALLWLSYPTKRRRSYPSWSWAGWIHNIVPDDVYSGFDSWRLHSSTLTCFRFGKDVTIKCFEENNIDRVHQIRRRAVRDGSMPSNGILSIREELRTHFTPPVDRERILASYTSTANLSGPPLSHYVFFWTSCSKLHVDREPRHMLKGEPTLGHFVIYASPPTLFRSIGFAELDVAWRAKQPDMLEFAVTTVGIRGRLWNVHSKPPDHVLLGLILIERCNEIMPSTYRRIPGVSAQVHQDDWALLKPQQRLIALV